MSKKELIEKIKKDIKKAGFKSEMKATSILLKEGWGRTINSISYNDKDENKSRELDILSVRQIVDDTENYSMAIVLSIEVKKSEKPWVVFSRNKIAEENSEPGWNILNSKYNLHSNNISEDIINNKNPLHQSSKIGTGFHEAFKSPNEKSQIYKALLTSCKAAVYQKDLYSKYLSGYRSGKKVLYFILPLVIVDGNLFETFLDNTGKISVIESNYIPIKLYYSSNQYAQKLFFSEIITINGFKKYLDKITLWLNDMFNNCNFIEK